MASFEGAITFVMNNEGGLSNNPNDPGGETKYGISHASFPLVDIQTLTLQQAEDLIKENYWRFDAVQSQNVATKLLDMSVNLGLGQAVRLLQAALKIPVDGEIGPVTQATCNGSPELQVITELQTEQQMFYIGLVAKNPTLYPFLRGWIARANRI